MGSVESAFNRRRNLYQDNGFYIPLAQAVIYRQFTRKTLVRNFKKLIPKDEYSEVEEKTLIDYLERLTNMTERVVKYSRESEF